MRFLIIIWVVFFLILEIINREIEIIIIIDGLRIFSRV